jgi:hypothetical protein
MAMLSPPRVPLSSTEVMGRGSRVSPASPARCSRGPARGSSRDTAQRTHSGTPALGSSVPSPPDGVTLRTQATLAGPPHGLARAPSCRTAEAA